MEDRTGPPPAPEPVPPLEQTPLERFVLSQEHAEQQQQQQDNLECITEQVLMQQVSEAVPSSSDRKLASDAPPPTDTVLSEELRPQLQPQQEPDKDSSVFPSQQPENSAQQDESRLINDDGPDELDDGEDDVDLTLLDAISQLLQAQYPSLSITTAVSAQKEPFISVQRKSLKGSEFCYFLPFRVIVRPSEGESTVFSAVLMDFSGRARRSEVLRVAEEVDSHILDELQDNRIRLCQGVRGASPRSGGNAQEMVATYINERILYRSRECEMLLSIPKRSSNIESFLQCAKCSQLAQVEQCSEHGENGKFEVVYTGEIATLSRKKTPQAENCADVDNLIQLGLLKVEEVPGKRGKKRRPPGFSEPDDPLTWENEDDDGSNLRQASQLGPGCYKYSSSRRSGNREETLDPINGFETTGRCIVIEDLDDPSYDSSIYTPRVVIKKEDGSFFGDDDDDDYTQGDEWAVDDDWQVDMDRIPRKRAASSGQQGDLRKRRRRQRRTPEEIMRAGAYHIDENGAKRPLTPSAANQGGRAPAATAPTEPKRKKQEDSKIKREKEKFYAKCDLCLFENDKRWVYEKHADLHEKRYNVNEPINCPVCNELFPTKHGLNPHFQEVHDSTKGVCIECRKVMLAKDVHRHLDYQHYVRAFNVHCSICNKAFRRRGEVEVHKAQKHNIGAKSVFCELCGKILPHPKLLAIHKQRFHDDRGRYKCPFCDTILENAAKWRKHLRMHSRHKPFKCPYCEHRALRKHRVLEHIRKVHKPDAVNDDVIQDGDFDYGVPVEELDKEKFRVPN